MFGERMRFEREISDLGLSFPLPREFDQPQPTKAPKPPPPCPETKKMGRRKLVFGGLEFTANAKLDLMRARSLLDAPDRNFIGWSGNRLGYDPAYATPADPFRWDKLKSIIDSCARVMIHKVKFTDNFKVARIDIDPSTNQERRRTSSESLQTVGGFGVTLVTEALDRAVYPTMANRAVSPDTDVSHAYYTTDANSKDQNALAHEFFGHVWLALQKAPYVHPNVPAITNAIGTIAPAHNILDPYGNIFSGTVRDFISQFIDRSLKTSDHNQTLYVGPSLYAPELAKFKKAFLSGAKGKLNGRWAFTPQIATYWQTVSANYEFAPPAGASAVSQPTIEADLSAFFATFSPDQQYVFLKFIDDISNNLLLQTALSSKLLATLTPPANMTLQPPTPKTFGGSPSTQSPSQPTSGGSPSTR